MQALAEFTGGTPIPASTAVITAGPTTSAAAREAGFTVQACPSAHPQEVAALAARLLGGRALSQEIYPEALPADHPSHSGAIADSALLSACRGERPARTPVWFMRQAGRSLPEYRAAREGTTMLESCLDPALAAELTLQPVRRYGVDAAIFYSDIMVPLKLAGVDVEIEPGVGPVLAHPVRSRDDIAALPTLTDEALAPIREAIGRVTAQLPDVPLIGFAGAPFTVASYLVEGRPNRTHPRTHELMHDDPQATLPSCAPRCWPAPVPCSCSTPGSASCRWPTTWCTCSPHPDAFCVPWASSACPASTSAPAPATCWWRCATPEPTSWAWVPT